MKKALLLAFAILLISGAVNAQLPPDGYIGLYADEAHSTQCVNGTGFYPFTLWIWCWPSVRGQICAEFLVQYPANVITSTVTPNDAIISVTLGDLANGMSVCYVGCELDWNWPFQQAMYCTDPTQTMITIGAHPDVGVYQFANCDSGYPTEPCIAYPSLLLNVLPDDCPEIVGTEETSWGAIKSLFK